MSKASEMQWQGAFRITCMKMQEASKELIALAMVGIKNIVRGF